MGEFAVAPWVPVSGFVQSNVEALERLFEYIQRHFPHTAAGLDFDLTAGFPDDPEQRATIASFFDTSQTTEDNASALAIKPTKRLGELLCDIRYGPHYVHRPTPLDHSKPYDQARMWAGALPETYSSLRVIPREVGDIVILADQQLSISDLTPKALIQQVTAYTRTIPRALKRSPWIARQIEKDDNGERAFATKADITRLVVESFFFNQIDWEHYDESVAQTVAPADTTDSKPTQAITDSTTPATPPREYELINYTLRNGRRVRIVNGRNDTSQAAGEQTPGSSNEIAGRLTRPKDDASLLVVRNLPAFDVGLDTIGNTLRDPVVGPAVATIDLCMSHIAKTLGVVPALYGLGGQASQGYPGRTSKSKVTHYFIFAPATWQSVNNCRQRPAHSHLPRRRDSPH